MPPIPADDKQPLIEKENMHPRNSHRAGYNFKQLCKSSSGLKLFVSVNQYGDESIDFSNPNAVKALNKALLKDNYGVDHWDIPEGYLCRRCRAGQITSTTWPICWPKETMALYRAAATSICLILAWALTVFTP